MNQREREREKSYDCFFFLGRDPPTHLSFLVGEREKKLKLLEKREREREKDDRGGLYRYMPDDKRFLPGS